MPKVVIEKGELFLICENCKSKFKANNKNWTQVKYCKECNTSTKRALCRKILKKNMYYVMKRLPFCCKCGKPSKIFIPRQKAKISKTIEGFCQYTKAYCVSCYKKSKR